MSLLSFSRTWDDGAPGWGQHSFNDAINAGYSGSDIAAFVNSGQIRIGQKAMDMAHGASSASRGNQAAIAAAQQQFDSQLQGYRTQLDDWTNRYSNMTNQYQTALAGKNEFEGKFKQASEDYEEAKALAEAYKGEAVNRQLDSLRRGGTYQGGQTTPYASIAAGAVSNRPRHEDSMQIDVDKGVSAEDSVLATKGPVIDVIRGGNSSSNRGPQSGSASAGSRDPNQHYVNRFG